MDEQDQQAIPERADNTGKDNGHTERISRSKARGKPGRPRCSRDSKSPAMRTQPRPIASKPPMKMVQPQPMIIPSSEKYMPVPIMPVHKSKSTTSLQSLAIISTRDTGASKSSDRSQSSAPKLGTEISAGPHVAKPGELGINTPITPNSTKAAHEAEHGALSKGEASGFTDSDHETDISSGTAEEDEVDASRDGVDRQSRLEEHPTPRSESPATRTHMNNEPVPLSWFTKNPHDDLRNDLHPSILAARGAVLCHTIYQNPDGSQYQISVVMENGNWVPVARHDIL